MLLFRRGLGIVGLVFVAALSLGTVGCGPSSGQINQAKTATYRAEPSVVFRAVVDAVADKYKVRQADAAAGLIATEARWHEPDGTYEDKAAGDSGVIGQDGSIMLGFEVRMTEAAGAYAVEVIPRAQQMRDGYAAPFPLTPDDPQMPGWVVGKTDDLYLRINAKLKRFEVKPGA